MSANFVGNTLTQSEAIEAYTPYDATSSRPRKTTIASFANFGGIEKLFCAPEQSLRRLERIFRCYSVCETMEDYKEGYLMV